MSEGKAALRFVLLLGLVSLFADVTYEGARSVTGPFLALLGAPAHAVGIVAGAGELLGYALRLASGYLADRTRQYWVLTFAGYAVNLGAVPLLALADRWPAAAALIVLERIGKAVRTPARDAMLSHAAYRLGRGWAFGLHEALDQIGAVAGPLVVAGVVAARGSYRAAFAVLVLPALCALVALAAARLIQARPRELEVETPELRAAGLPRTFWIFLAGAALMAAGYVDFSLIAFHWGRRELLAPSAIPLYYGLAMVTDAAAALLVGRSFDRRGLVVLIWTGLASAASAPLAFLGGPRAAALGMIAWGIGMGAQESVVRAAVAGMVPPAQRGAAYGVFNAGYGVCWFLGSAVMGGLYGISAPALVLFSVLAQLGALPLFWRARAALRGPG
ncbi:MAG TPA: MFS transporter [bacterium]|nr:MFS transporter [bacterium]